MKTHVFILTNMFFCISFIANIVFNRFSFSWHNFFHMFDCASSTVLDFGRNIKNFVFCFIHSEFSISTSIIHPVSLSSAVANLFSKDMFSSKRFSAYAKYCVIDNPYKVVTSAYVLFFQQMYNILVHDDLIILLLINF